MKAETCSCCVLSVNYVLYNKVVLDCMFVYFVKSKLKQSRYRPCVAQSVPDCHDIRHMKVVRLSVSRTGHLYPQEMFLVLIFTMGLCRPQVRSEGICHWKIQWHHPESIPGPSDYKRSALTTTPPQAPYIYIYIYITCCQSLNVQPGHRT